MKKTIPKLLTLVCLLVAVMGLSIVTAHAATVTGIVSSGNEYRYHEDKSPVSQWGPYTSNKLRYFTRNDTRETVPAYCMEPEVRSASGDLQYSSTSWSDLTWNQRYAVTLAMAYGYGGNYGFNMHPDCAQLATQAVVWEFVCGYRSAVYPYTLYDTTCANLFHYAGDDVAVAYNIIIDRIMSHGVIPSFAVKYRNQLSDANAITLTWDGSQYVGTATDTNGVLPQYYFSTNISGVTVNQSWNTLTVTATKDAAAQLNGYISSDYGYSLDVAGTESVLLEPSNGSGYQACAALTSLPDPVWAYIHFKVKIVEEKGSITVRKVDVTGSPLAGAELMLETSTDGKPWTEVSRIIIAPKGDEDRGQNDYFYKAAEGVVASVILLLAEFLSPDSKHPMERRHLVSVFILIQQLLAPSGVRGKTYFKQLMDMLPPHHRARNLASSALESSDQATASAMSTALAQMNTFMDIALEQVICFDSNIDAEKFAKEKTAIFLVLPEEDRTKNFMAGLMVQNLSKELFELAEKGKGRLPSRVAFYCDEFGTMPAFDVEALFSAGRSRGITLVPIIQSLAQLEKNYGREGAEILTDNCQDTIFGGFAPNSQTAEQLSKSLGSRTVLSGSVSKGKNDPSQSLQMIERPLMTPDELKSIPKGSFVVMKTGTHPMQTKLRLFLDWGITFGEPYATPEHAARPVAYASRQELFLSISKRYSSSDRPVQAQQASATQRRTPRSAMGLYSEDTRP